MKDLALLALKLSIFTIPHLAQRFCSSIVGIWVGFRLLLGCRVLCLHCGRCLSRGSYNVPFFLPQLSPLLNFAFKEDAETAV